MKRALAVALVVCAACGDSPVKGLVRFTPPPIYATWWAKTEQCSGLTAPMNHAATAWWTTPNNETLDNAGEIDEGVFFGDDRAIALQSSHQFDETLVRHEMLHAILLAHGITGHPPAYFVTRCHLTWDTA